MATNVKDHGRLADHLLEGVHPCNLPLERDRLACLSDGALNRVPFALEVEKG